MALDRARSIPHFEGLGALKTRCLRVNGRRFSPTPDVSGGGRRRTVIASSVPAAVLLGEMASGSLHFLLLFTIKVVLVLCTAGCASIRSGVQAPPPPTPEQQNIPFANEVVKWRRTPPLRWEEPGSVHEVARVSGTTDHVTAEGGVKKQSSSGRTSEEKTAPSQMQAPPPRRGGPRLQGEAGPASRGQASVSASGRRGWSEAGLRHDVRRAGSAFWKGCLLRRAKVRLLRPQEQGGRGARGGGVTWVGGHRGTDRFFLQLDLWQAEDGRG